MSKHRIGRRRFVNVAAAASAVAFGVMTGRLWASAIAPSISASLCTGGRRTPGGPTVARGASGADAKPVRVSMSTSSSR